MPSRSARRFRARGQRLWEAHRDEVDGERGLVMLEEACRIVDRLDQLDRLLKGDIDVWCSIVDRRVGRVEVQVDGPLIEARQQANVLRQILAGLPLQPARGGDDAGGDGDWADEAAGV